MLRMLRSIGPQILGDKLTGVRGLNDIRLSDIRHAAQRSSRAVF